ncbi:MAG: rod shape-determining protein MreC [Phycisphaerales bacterium]
MPAATPSPSALNPPLLGALGVLVILSFLPSRWLGWTSFLGAITTRAVAPVSQPAHTLARWVSGAGGERDDALMAQLERERDHFRFLYHQEQARSEDIRRTLEQIQQGKMVNDLPVVPLLRPVIGGASDGRGGQLLIRAGRSQGVEVNVVAATAGVQVAGKVVHVDARTCWVRLLTHPDAGAITGVVMTADEKPGVVCQLFPTKAGGVLRGEVAYTPGRPPPMPGQTVRLDDPQWPKSSRMLVLGTITDIKTIASGRQVVEVKPTAELDRLSEVVLRLNPALDDGAAASPPGAPGARGTTGKAR